MKYEAILELETQYSITLLTKIAGVSRSAYYRYKNKPKSVNSKLEELIVYIYRKSGKRKGYRTITSTLKNDYNLKVNHKKVLRIMREHNIQSIIRKKKRKHKKEKTIHKKNILNRDFQSDTPYKKLVTDITYIPTRRKMVYLCVLQDLYNNEPVAWTVSDSQDKSLSIDTIKQLAEKCSLQGALIHSDQGVHYTNTDYVNLLKNLSITQSMSRKGNCWDNACAESFFSHFKCETIHLMKQKPENLQEVIDMTQEYMVYYIHDRPQRKLGGLTPSLYKKQLNTA